ncbi:hypothetical protein Maq22A_1p38315 (plasmid) [Methylobacterium aquaticum]|uniref:Uncharacterized protein n=1 Tax=Methylobacterium aquaticum TaxID=270351 RepID=A0A1Y0ZCC9_9HYPH|nr:hypothetical protein Maq22A_1p38315 [Methylobacterium aquaticum]
MDRTTQPVTAGAIPPRERQGRPGRDVARLPSPRAGKEIPRSIFQSVFTRPLSRGSEPVRDDPPNRAPSRVRETKFSQCLP